MTEIDPKLIQAIDKVGKPVLDDYNQMNADINDIGRHLAGNFTEAEHRGTEKHEIIGLLGVVLDATEVRIRNGYDRVNDSALQGATRELSQLGYELSDYEGKLYSENYDKLAEDMMAKKEARQATKNQR